jgi:carbonic anhydrase
LYRYAYSLVPATARDTTVPLNETGLPAKAMASLVRTFARRYAPLMTSAPLAESLRLTSRTIHTASTLNPQPLVTDAPSKLNIAPVRFVSNVPTNPDLDKVVLSRNREWAAETERSKPGFFSSLLKQQFPEYLWIGCADSRVPANVIVDMAPGELFVHRNVANLVVHTDINCLSVLQYAVEVLKVKHILVVGHYGCGGVRAALENQKNGLIDNWLRNIQDIVRFQSRELSKHIGNKDKMVDRLCELNVTRQALNVGQTTVLQDAWARGQNVSVHGLIYSLHDGLLKDMRVSCTSSADVTRYEEMYMKKAFISEDILAALGNPQAGSATCTQHDHSKCQHQ